MTDQGAIAERYFILHPAGTVEEVSADGETTIEGRSPGLYERLVAAGYPPIGNPDSKPFDRCLDITVDWDLTTVTVHTQKPATEHRIPAPAAALFLDWIRAEAGLTDSAQPASGDVIHAEADGNTDTITLRAVEHGESWIVIDRAEYEDAKRTHTLDLLLDAHLSDIDSSTVVYEPDGTRIDPYA